MCFSMSGHMVDIYQDPVSSQMLMYYPDLTINTQHLCFHQVITCASRTCTGGNAGFRCRVWCCPVNWRANFRNESSNNWFASSWTSFQSQPITNPQMLSIWVESQVSFKQGISVPTPFNVIVSCKWVMMILYSFGVISKHVTSVLFSSFQNMVGSGCVSFINFTLPPKRGYLIFVDKYTNFSKRASLQIKFL